MASLPLTLMLHLATVHAPQVAPENIITFAHVESRMNPYALYDNTGRRSYAPKTAAEASDLARKLLDLGHSIDTGVMQINSANFEFTGLDHVSAFKPEHSIRAAAMILLEAYQRCAEKGLASDPLRCMASIYNTGNHRRGERNGYVGRIYAAAEQLIPAIRQATSGSATPQSPPAQSQEVPPHGCGPPPRSWDGWATTAYRRCIKKSQANPPQSESQKNEVQ